MNVTGTHFAYYWICHRKLWLFANGINMEHTSEAVSDGRFIHETTYERRANKFTEIEVGGVKIDFYDPFQRVIHETKRSDSIEEAHQWQVKYYIWVLEQHGVLDVTGLLEYPTMRQTQRVELTDTDRQTLEMVIAEIARLVESDSCPPRVRKGICRNCSYNDFCWSGEE
ncbi:MAG: CRISPR-associated protein Cas4 [Tenuifilaceae bacterium]|jgi:CRISPR-associated exonuclease Cas4|nr:CRISPR-associated protein Cas4 [Tenuifilaceae bacterium]